MTSLENILYPAIDLLGNGRIAKNPQTALFGLNAEIDSIGLFSLIAAAEEMIEKESGRKLSLATPKTLSIKPSPFRTVGTLAQFIDEQLRERF